ncbi:MAG: hypothetical protein HZA49_07985 [Planctomycetes bacterium]|nr:hypothetical protein [Planctomycetota bacterium]
MNQNTNNQNGPEQAKYQAKSPAAFGYYSQQARFVSGDGSAGGFFR